MVRTADFTIEGFMYQFNKTLLELLRSKEDDLIQVEGYIEDIDFFSDDSIKGIQCKYYESCNKFKNSLILEPILQMMCTFCEVQDKYDIRFELYIYYNDCTPGKEIALTNELISSLLETGNKECIVKFFPRIFNIKNPIITELSSKAKKTEQDKKQIIKYFKKSQSNLSLKFDVKTFVQRTHVICGESFNSIQESVKKSLCDLGHSQVEVDQLFYPNAIQNIATISTKHNSMDRKINKRDFCEELFNSKKLLYSKWNKEAITKEQYIKRKRKEISSQLQINSRNRVIILDDKINGFLNEVDSLITDYIQVYYKKEKLQKIPMFIIASEDSKSINSIEIKLNKKKIKFINGIIGGKLDIEALLEDVKLHPTAKLRLCKYCKEVEDYIIQCRPDDVLIFGNINTSIFKLEITNIDKFFVDNIDDIKKILKLRGVN